MRWAGVLWTMLAVAGCSSTPPAVPEPTGAALVPRHWDQVCNESRRKPTAVRISELFDTAGLGATLAEIGIKPLPLAPPWPLYDFITRYDASGRPLVAGTWDATTDPAVTSALEGELKARVRPLGGLLEPTGFRSRIVFARRVTFDVAGPVECMPHMVHRSGERPLGLPDHVTTWGGSVFVREGDTTTAVVRIHVERDGSVFRVEEVGGAPRTLERTRDVIRRLSFEPALSNGVPVRGVLVQAFRFRDAVASPHRSGGPVTMPPQGAFAPWRSPTPTP